MTPRLAPKRNKPAPESARSVPRREVGHGVREPLVLLVFPRRVVGDGWDAPGVVAASLCKRRTRIWASHD
jgi:hypothetical protein